MSEREQGRAGPQADDREELAGHVATWWEAVGAFTALVDELVEEGSDEVWATPTDLAGWDVHAVVAHVAHLEAVLAGAPEETVDVGEPAHVRGLLGLYCEQGVVARRNRRPAELVAEVRAATAERHRALLADPPTDGGARAPRTPGGVPWDWRTLLRNRPLDVWMHEQDVRRAVGRPGGLDSAAAAHTAAYLTESLGFVLAKKVGAEPGTTVRLDVEGHHPVAFEVTAERRGRRLADLPASPTATVGCDRESFVLLAGGRRVPADGAVRLGGDADLARRVVGELAVTP